MKQLQSEKNNKPNERKKTRKFFNRELSWLHFNARVLRQATDPTIPLLERLNFLGIFTNNLDEFFMKRVGGIIRHLDADIIDKSNDGLTPKEQLKAIRSAVVPQIKRSDEVFLFELLPQLEEHGVELLSWYELSDSEKKFATDYFHKNIFPILTPLAVDAGHPFPFLSNLSTSIGVSLNHPDHSEPLFARVKVSHIRPEWIQLHNDRFSDSYRFISVREVVEHHLESLFPNMNVLSKMLFRVTRNIALEIDEEDIFDIRELMEEELRLRKKGKVIRLEHGPEPDPWILQFLQEELELHDNDIYAKEGELEYSALRQLVKLPLPDLRYPSWVPVTPPVLREEGSMFSLIRSRDILVHHPYESFSSSVERFMREAAEDERVKSIKMTLYRVGEESPLIPLLIKAAERGKDVVCLIELKARFDERTNMVWAQKLEEAGVHVIFGITGLKTHAKTLLVVREESDGFRTYAHLGTGNYHSQTANLYTDLGLFTAKPEYTTELHYFFHSLTGRSRKDDYQKLLVAPVNMGSEFIRLIHREKALAVQGKPTHIMAKMNSLEDKEIIEALYEASQAGVRIDLFVRGLCCLRPQVEGLSENIQVISVIGRLLEHSRAYYFRNGAPDPIDGEFFIGSADWMNRNLYRRIEVIAPLEERLHREMIWKHFQIILLDNGQAWYLGKDGGYDKPVPEAGEKIHSTQEKMMELLREK